MIDNKLSDETLKSTFATVLIKEDFDDSKKYSPHIEKLPTAALNAAIGELISRHSKELFDIYKKEMINLEGGFT